MIFIYKTIDVDGHSLKIGRGQPLPYGAYYIEKGVNFSVFSSSADEMILVVFESGKESSLVEIEMSGKYNKTGNVWHIYIEGLPDNFKYGYRANGEFNPKEGKFFDEGKVLSDPYSLSLSGGAEWGKPFEREGKSFGYTRRSYIVKSDFDWENDIHLNTPFHDTIIYELHLRGFTRGASSKVEHKGTFKGLKEKIPYLKELGVTAIELMPIQEFDELGGYFFNPETGEKLFNYWGYSTLAFFTPKASYAFEGKTGGQVDEFKDMVKAFHKAGIEVILDVVFNHTAEGSREDTIFSFKGLDAGVYYMIDDDGKFMNYSGCGNTMNCNHPVVRSFILDALRYWVTEMHIDGFRFDLASIMGRDENGNVLPNPPIIEHIAKDPVLANTKIIAEAWDAAGLYQVGSFPGERWAEWNGKYRDCVRRFVRGDDGMVEEFVTRFLGSPDMYQKTNRQPFHSINFITSHDGFTMNDLVSYNNKHNYENGEDNRDGDNNNSSYNYGFEGETDDVEINKIRRRQITNFFTILLLSQGTPMILAGDEFGRTQKGNNNAYCQDSDTSWVNWNLLEKNRGLFEYVKKLILFRKETKLFGLESFREDITNVRISYHGIEPNKPGFEYYSRSIAVMLENSGDIKSETYKKIYIAFNFWEEALKFKLPGGRWELKIDTSTDALFYANSAIIGKKYYEVKPFSIAVLVDKKD